MTRRVLRRSAAAAAALALFAGFLAWLFPTEAVVRHALARVTPAGSPSLTFAAAALRPDGVHLVDVAVCAPAGVPLVRADDVRLRPSLRGLLSGGRGLPWELVATVCGGRTSARVSADGAVIAVALTWEDANVAACPFLPIAAGALGGRARGAARFQLDPAAAPEGTGRVELAAGSWQGAGLLQALGTLHAESAVVSWTLHDGRLALDALELRGPELTANGSGEVELADPLAESPVQLTLALATAADAPGVVRLLLGPPGADRRLRVGGTLARPSALVQ